jgi:hypothetical protein
MVRTKGLALLGCTLLGLLLWGCHGEKVRVHSKLIETSAGTTVWTRSARGTAPVASVKLVSRGPVDFGARDPEEAYGALARCLTGDISGDFYSRWVRP